ncbi:hypothetical protein [Amycolatopsis regifaucium]|uniref:Uncharacterized protein n=1 Tax=Amycolatopsis regifaucium TaxID=546365 RepID=A0A154MU16_9PSEU|nr:hypothetical protein [Amycolatopsis regifaucium]KZB87786.1 hypothetical protein AVL48_22525 [Amycolatopsis regifaucium]OKA08256.1 hypothetical protein ATP06_0213290 [Amycolatopsis regifaucium]
MPGEDEDKRPSAASSARKRRRVDEIFGDVLPDTTSDEREPGRRSPDSDSWYLENRPPHHDR